MEAEVGRHVGGVGDGAVSTVTDPGTVSGLQDTAHGQPRGRVGNPQTNGFGMDSISQTRGALLKMTCIVGCLKANGNKCQRTGIQVSSLTKT